MAGRTYLKREREPPGLQQLLGKSTAQCAMQGLCLSASHDHLQLAAKAAET